MNENRYTRINLNSNEKRKISEVNFLYDIISAERQRSMEVLCRWLTPIYACCVSRGYIPRTRKTVRVAIYPKTEKSLSCIFEGFQTKDSLLFPFVDSRETD